MKSLAERKKARAATRQEEAQSRSNVVISANYSGMKKADLIAEVERRGYQIEKSDTVESLIQTLKNDDAEKASKSGEQQE